MEVDQRELGRELPADFSNRIGLEIGNISLITRALTHRSYVNEHADAVEDNERLEFLGDAVLDFLVGAWLYNHYPEMAEGELTRLRSALVRTEQLARFGEQIRLGAALRLGRGEDLAGGRKRDALLCAAFEALVGAIYLDGGIDAVKKFIHPMLATGADHILSGNRDRDPKSMLQERVQAMGFGPPQYRTVSSSGPEHDKTFDVEVSINGQVFGRGSGHSKQTAAKEAATVALNSFEAG